ncbi:MAG: flagellar hook capping FlgD N-terminal domain-containing protein, partial [Gammaproteobacteria bacterium]|nr:flagellar hook capping FlgD N-terminal domain-containing protein [Gammaproteobacteria bacterium]
MRTLQENQQAEVKRTSTLGQDDFLKLLTTQLQYQDPMEPMENGEFLGQMAQFSTVTGITEMQTSLENMVSAFQ